MTDFVEKVLKRTKQLALEDFSDSIDKGEGEDTIDALELATLETLEDIDNLPILLAKDSKGISVPKYQQDVMDDYDFTRKTITMTIEESQKTLKETRKLFAITSNPKHGELIVKMLNLISDNAKMLFDLHADTISSATKQEKSEVNIDATSGGTVLVATSAEILQALQTNRRNKDEL